MLQLPAPQQNPPPKNESSVKERMKIFGCSLVSSSVQSSGSAWLALVDKTFTCSLSLSFVFVAIFQVGPVCWRRGSVPRGAAVPLFTCPRGSRYQDGLCYPPCPPETFVAGPVCWDGYGRGAGATPANKRPRDHFNRGQHEINMIKTKFSPLTDAEATSCETNPLAVTIWAQSHLSAFML